MDSKTHLMIAIGAAIGANCIPCFDHLYAKAKEARLSDAEIEQVVELAFKIKNGAHVFMKKAVGDVANVALETAGGCCENECTC